MDANSRRRCGAQTLRGDRCRLPAAVGSRYCTRHTSVAGEPAGSQFAATLLMARRVRDHAASLEETAFRTLKGEIEGGPDFKMADYCKVAEFVLKANDLCANLEQGTEDTDAEVQQRITERLEALRSEVKSLLEED